MAWTSPFLRLDSRWSPALPGQAGPGACTPPEPPEGSGDTRGGEPRRELSRRFPSRGTAEPRPSQDKSASWLLPRSVPTQGSRHSPAAPRQVTSIRLDRLTAVPWSGAITGTVRSERTLLAHPHPLADHKARGPSIELGFPQASARREEAAQSQWSATLAVEHTAGGTEWAHKGDPGASLCPEMV